MRTPQPPKSPQRKCEKKIKLVSERKCEVTLVSVSEKK